MSDRLHEYDIRLVLTCGVCPEQYDAFDPDGAKVGFLRLRNGVFSVSVPNRGGDVVLQAHGIGDGCFNDDGKRTAFLLTARVIIAAQANRARGVPEED